MLFSGIPFLYYFLPCALILYHIAPKCLKNTVLLLVSLFFYAWGEPKYVFLMLAMILAGYLSGLLIGRFRGSLWGKVFLGIAVTAYTAVLGYFKYADFFIRNYNAATGGTLSLLQIALPIGISFYTFQIISYNVDVYRGEAARKEPIALAAYITMFPQLIAGPIVRYKDVAKQLEDRTCTVEMAACGIRRFVTGLAKKILLANALGELCDIFKASDDKSVLFYWMYAAAFTLHIYFDFSGYSDMAIGLGKMFGFSFMENFNYPYISKSITEFWRRWHISLGSWFRDYVYIPLGGNRVTRWRWLFNIFLVWMLTGLWHGASWNFVLWGLWFAFFLVIEKLWLLKYLKKSRVLGRIYVLLMVMLGFVLFDAANVKEAALTVGGMFGINAGMFSGFVSGAAAEQAAALPLISAEAVYYLRSYGAVYFLAVLAATPLPARLLRRIRQKKRLSAAAAIAEPILCAALFLVMTAYLVDGSFNPFLYFRF